ncbi:group II intron reverse transcriptase/maturase [Bacillus sp. GM_Baccil_2]|uniref:group II intron reverse transcriptase/maturase n=1 Tax=Bacillus sp. GM_Baccil_2 TaxID=2937369 RepID=UPI00226A5106
MTKKVKLRHNEYYDIQKSLDELYVQSKNRQNFYNLINLMKTEENIRLAYRNIKTNKGSRTPGVDGLAISDVKSLSIDAIVGKIKTMFDKYQPQPVRRVLIPKEGGNRNRPLGIPTIWDRLFQQCILQILEPICEAQFHNHSYGFRPNRGTSDAIARLYHRINIAGHHYCVDVDIKSFFDNVNHGKLLKQMWSMGIRDKSLLCIISRLLKSEIKGEGIPNKGTPQGGILSPLLSNIVLNELDWWISDQWETFDAVRTNGEPYSSSDKKYRELKKTNLKEMYIIRYADDFKITCRTYEDAQKAFHAVNDFLKYRLGLDINKEKSKVINMRKNTSKFLGLKIKVVRKHTSIDPKSGRKRRTRNGYVAQSQMSDKAKEKAYSNIKRAIKKIQRKPTGDSAHNYNLVVIGIQNYYSMATYITVDLGRMEFSLRKVLYYRLEKHRTKATLDDFTKSMQKRYKGYNWKLFKIDKTGMVPIAAQKHRIVYAFQQNICNYTKTGRDKIHKDLRNISNDVLRKVMRTYIPNRSIEYNDNRISKYIAQNGKCWVTKYVMGIDEVHCHHKIPYHISSDDSFGNLVIVSDYVHKLIHMTNIELIKERFINLEMTKKDFKTTLKRLNELRILAGTEEIKFSTKEIKQII